MTLDELERPRFYARDVRRVTGLSTPHQTYWRKCGVLISSAETPLAHVYSALDILRFCLVYHLSETWFTPAVAVDMCRELFTNKHRNTPAIMAAFSGMQHWLVFSQTEAGVYAIDYAYVDPALGSLAELPELQKFLGREVITYNAGLIAQHALSVLDENSTQAA